jgi:hypothetical protein
MSPTPHLEHLYEWAEGWLAEATADRQANLVRNVVLLGAESRNGYRYTKEAMQQATPLYEGRPVFIDHPETQPTQRKLRNYAGQVVQPRFENERLRGDVKLLGPNASWLMELIEAAPRDIGMSHVVLARRGAKGETVEQIERVLSVDIVAFPATTVSFREQCHLSSHVPSLPPVSPSEGRERQLSLVRLVEQSRLPPRARSAALHQLLAGCPDPQKFLTDLEGYWETLLLEPATSREKPAFTSISDIPLSTVVRNALVAAVKGSDFGQLREGSD